MLLAKLADLNARAGAVVQKTPYLVPIFRDVGRRLVGIRKNLLAFYQRWRLVVDTPKCRLQWPLALRAIPAGLTGGSLWAAYVSSICLGHVREWTHAHESSDEKTHEFDFCLSEIPNSLYTEDPDMDDVTVPINRDANMERFTLEFMQIVFPDDIVTSELEDSYRAVGRRQSTRVDLSGVEYHMEAIPAERTIKLSFIDSVIREARFSQWDAPPPV